MTDPTRLVLASNSPRRRQLLELTGWTFSVLPADVDENLLPGEEAAAYVMRLADSKAQAVSRQTDAQALVLAADTTVVDGDAILGKPGDAGQAMAMLLGLRGHAHRVYTGLALCRGAGAVMVSDLCQTEVPMRAYTDQEVQDYVASGDPLDKAGAYGIQHPHFHPVESMQGCYASVMGLPLCHLQRSLAHLGVEAVEDIPARCQAALSYQCPVWRSILRNEIAG